MEQLRHIYIPKGMSHKNIFKLLTLNKLRTLWGMRVGDWLADDAKMWNFPNLQKLYLFNIYSRHQLDTIFGSLIKSLNLRKLKLEWDNFSSNLTKLQSLDIDTLNKHCCKLSALILDGPIKENDHAIRFPPNLVVLELKWSGIKGHDPFLLIGNCCPKLKVLKFVNVAYRGTEMRCSAGAYPCLIELVVDCMYELETWVIETGALPRLEKLFLYNTRKLTRLPEGLRFVTTLRELILK
ncbi:disease resistance protein RPP8-like [Amaranthus tricolor]|uniref:disease resistance protein RPP8-like n=1 Tax=Amaranthus tricolor TaxID=29722 RepID=UPI002590E953|nr:disease resistance protein RPP8-like [Amaranthus tricolor]